MEAALRERVKELTCLYGIAELAVRPGVTLEEILRGILELLPGAWQYPEICVARIVLEGVAHASRGFREGPRRLAADIVLDGRRRGMVEVAYLEERPFLPEERKLIDAVAGQLALILQRRKAEEDQSNLQEQLRHADRLATLGQLAAGVAHELNEPLAAILGLAELAMKPKDVPGQARRDMEKVKAVCLQAREVIRKLLLFARQAPPEEVLVCLNQGVREGLGFLEARCAKAGVDLVLELAPDLPPVVCDPAQMNQVLVNLVVNALQAMPRGGRLTVRTETGEDDVALVVRDTGVGMTREVLGKIFVPFFTTKEVGQGTGLGLPVVHGIVTAHQGTIRVDSRPGRGTRVEIRLPRVRPAGAAESR